MTGWMEALELLEYEDRYKQRLLEFYLPPEQQDFTALPAGALELALTDPDRRPMVILADGEAAGFFVLHTGKALEEYGADSASVLIRALSVDYACQGRGIAGAAMRLLPGFVRKRYPAATRLVLAVNEDNTGAQRLYAKIGFRDGGRRRIGVHGPQRIMEYDLGR